MELYLDDGSFFGTLCAIEPAQRAVGDEAIIEMFTGLAKEVGAILSEGMRQVGAAGSQSAA